MGGSQSFATYATIQWYIYGKNSYGSKGFNAAKKLFRDGDIADMKGKHVAITGSNRGLGYAAALEFAKLNADVHLLCRSETKGREAAEKIIAATSNKKVFAHVCDASSISSVKAFSSSFISKYGTLDVLVNNAGCMPPEKIMTDDEHDSIMASALVGSQALTSALLPCLSKATGFGRVINVVSGGAYTVNCPDPTDLDFKKLTKYNATLIYAFAKRSQIILTEWWAKLYPKDDVRFYAMHPGWAVTEGVNEALEGGRLGVESTDGFRTAAEGIDTVVYIGSTTQAEEVLSKENNGKLWFDRVVVDPHIGFGTRCNDDKKTKLWNAANAYVGLKDPLTTTWSL